MTPSTGVAAAAPMAAAIKVSAARIAIEA